MPTTSEVNWGTASVSSPRQKHILIGDTHGFIDLVFYRRTLKCPHPLTKTNCP